MICEIIPTLKERPIKSQEKLYYCRTILEIAYNLGTWTCPTFSLWTDMTQDQFLSSVNMSHTLHYQGDFKQAEVKKKKKSIQEINLKRGLTLKIEQLK